MPLTSKGREILSSMEKTYGSEKKAKQVLYASKNAGKISGVDEAPAASVSSASLPPNPTGGMPTSSRESPVPAKDQMMLPTLDQFRRQFRDALKAGHPLSKCLDMGVTWTGMNSSEAKWQDTRDAFRNAVRDALRAGKTTSDAIQAGLDEVPQQRLDMGKVSGQGGIIDKASDRQAFVKGCKDALAAGKSSRDAIAAGYEYVSGLNGKSNETCSCHELNLTRQDTATVTGHIA